MKTPEAIEILKNMNGYLTGNISDFPDIQPLHEALDHIIALHTGGRTEPCCEEFTKDIYLFYMVVKGRSRFTYCPYCGAYIRDIQITNK